MLTRVRVDPTGMPQRLRMSLEDHPADGSVPAPAFADIRTRKGVVLVRLVGPSVSQRETPIVARAIHAELNAVGRGLKQLVIDASEIRLMSSLALGMCIDARNTASRSGAKTVIYGLSADLRRLFKLTKVDRLFTFADSQRALTRALAA